MTIRIWAIVLPMLYGIANAIGMMKKLKFSSLIKIVIFRLSCNARSFIFYRKKLTQSVTSSAKDTFHTSNSLSFPLSYTARKSRTYWFFTKRSLLNKNDANFGKETGSLDLWTKPNKSIFQLKFKNN